MKYIQLKVEDKLHKEIKLQAIDRGKTINQYILDCIQLVTLQNNMAEKMDKDYMLYEGQTNPNTKIWRCQRTTYSK